MNRHISQGNGAARCSTNDCGIGDRRCATTQINHTRALGTDRTGNAEG